nr:MAG TPA: hypothetical protein [Caudoviricetes sp.]
MIESLLPFFFVKSLENQDFRGIEVCFILL